MFKILETNKINKARLGLVSTRHGNIETPFFMPDATRAVLKGLDDDDLSRLGLPAMVVNTYHLYLQPGMEIIKIAGGVHCFMGFDRPLLSDSGGFQVFSLIHKNKEMGKIMNDKVLFRSPIDGSKHEITPEKSIQIQFDLGTDMIVCFDDCPPNDYDDKAIARSVDRTIEWAKRCRTEYDRQVKKRKIRISDKPVIFAVIQGGLSVDLRDRCASALKEIGFDGYGFGARPVDKDGNFLSGVLQATADSAPEDSIRFGLGIGLPEDIIRCVAMGWDMFDCVIPTREGRHGRLFYKKKKLSFKDPKGYYETLNINNSRFARDFSPINKMSRLPELRDNSRAYLYHLFKINDPLGQRLASLNNLEFYTRMMEEIKEVIGK